VGIPSSDPQYTIRPLQTVEPWRDNLCNSPECDLVCNPCVRGGSQKAYTTIGFDSPYLRMLMFVLKTLESFTHSLIQSANPSLMLVEDPKNKIVLDNF
jgi:hypothetical protein